MAEIVDSPQLSPDDSDKTLPPKPAPLTSLSSSSKLDSAEVAHEAQIFVSIGASDLFRQAEILSNLIQRRRSLKSLLPAATPEIIEIMHPYAILISQDCDLERDASARKDEIPDKIDTASDKILPNVLFCEVVTVEQLLAAVPKGKDIWKRIVQNKDERYHVLEKVPPSQDSQGTGLPALGIDFKRYFTVPTDELYVQVKTGTIRRCRLCTPYLEHFSNRLAHFLSRVALPRDHNI
ncbi:MAG: hypothetical protein WBQ04_04470 [Candidatus Acidiferrales bacterium]